MAIVIKGAGCDCDDCPEDPCDCPISVDSATTYPHVGVAFSYSIVATCEMPITSYAHTSGTMPTGLSLNTSTGEISGTPTTAGVYSIQVSGTSCCGTAYAIIAFEVDTCVNLCQGVDESGDGPEGVGFDRTYSNGALGCPTTTLYIEWEFYSRADRLLVEYGSTVLLDTGCVTGSGSTTTSSFGGGGDSLRIRVYQDCTSSGMDSAWAFTAVCV